MLLAFVLFYWPQWWNRDSGLVAPPQRLLSESACCLQSDIVDSAYTPIIQSGGDYNFKLGSGGSSDKPIHYGVIVCSLGARWVVGCLLPGRRAGLCTRC